MDIVRVAVAALLSIAVAVGGYKKKSLSASGAIAGDTKKDSFIEDAIGLIVGFVTTLCGYRFAFTLIAFFISSSILTKYKSSKKKNLEEGFKEGGQRNWIQVLANGGAATIVAVLYLYYEQDEIPVDYSTRFIESCFLMYYLGHYACCNGDTWASEIGILSSSEPRLLTTFSKVPKGTNGGISPLGTFASIAGGAFIGFVFWITGLVFCVQKGATPPPQTSLVVVGALAGLVGSLVINECFDSSDIKKIDSFLGATLQYSGYCTEQKRVVSVPSKTTKHISGYNILDNHQVNAVSAVLTALLTAYAAQYIV